MTSSGLDEKLLQDYEDYYYQLEPWHKGLDEHVGNIILTHEIFPEKELDKTEYYNDWGKAIGIHHGIGGFIGKNNDYTLKIGFHRPKKSSQFEAGDLSFLQLIATHINRAVKINHEIIGAQDSYSSILAMIERLSIAAILIDDTKRPVFFNKKAEDIFEQKIGLSIKNNQLITHRHRDTQVLDKLIHEAVLTGLGQGLSDGGDLLLRQGKQTKPLQIQVLPLSTHRNNLGINEHKVCAVVLVKSADDAVNKNANLMQLLYGLTLAEIKLVIELASGLSLNQIAEKYQLSKHTVRNQLKSCFNKTDTHRQLELVKLVLTHFG